MQFNLGKQDAYVAVASSAVTVLALGFLSHLPAVGAAVKFLLGF